MIQRAHLGRDCPGDEEAADAMLEEELSGSAAGHRARARGWHTVPATLKVKEHGTDLWLGSPHH